MGLTPYGVIPHTDVKVGDLIEINTVTVFSGTVLDVDKEMVKLSTPDGGAGYWVDADQIDFQPASWTAISARDRRVILVNRPEPPKPAAKVGDTLTRDHQIPPVGTKVVRVDEYDGRLLIRELQTDGRWHLLNSTEYAKATSLFSSVYDYSVVHLPSE